MPAGGEERIEKIGETVFLRKIGFTGGDRILVMDDGINIIDERVDDLRDIWENGLNRLIP